MSARVCVCGESFHFLPRTAPEFGAVTICADCGRAYRFVPALEPIEWDELEIACTDEPAWVLEGFEHVRRAAPHPNRELERAGRFRNVEHAGSALGLVLAVLLLLVAWKAVLS